MNRELSTGVEHNNKMKQDWLITSHIYSLQIYFVWRNTLQAIIAFGLNSWET